MMSYDKMDMGMGTSLLFGEEVPEPIEEPKVTTMLPRDVEGVEQRMLTEEEKKMVNEFVDKIDLTNSSAIMHYGVAVQKKMADFSDKALDNVKTKDLGEIGSMITGLVTELKSFDVEEKKGIMKIFSKPKDKFVELKAKYDTAEVNVEKISNALEEHQIQLMRDINLLDKLYDMNLAYFKELSMYILAGKKKIEQARMTELKQLQDTARISNCPEDAQAAKDYEDLLIRFEKKISDLELSRAISLQTAPQIRLVQNNDTIMVEKIQSTVVNTIPLWKNQMVIALGIQHSTEAAKAQRQVTDMTNELLKRNAAALKIATVETAKESERGIVDLATLKETNASLISTMDEVLKIQEDGRVRRLETEKELRRMEDELKSKLLSVKK